MLSENWFPCFLQNDLLTRVKKIQHSTYRREKPKCRKFNFGKLPGLSPNYSKENLLLFR